LAELDVEHQYVDEQLYAVQQPKSALGFDVRYLGFCVIRVFEHELAQPSEPHIPLNFELSFLRSFESIAE